MNDGITVCISVLLSVLLYLEDKKRHKLRQMTNSELVEVLTPYATSIGQFFASMSSQQLVQFRALRGVPRSAGIARNESRSLSSAERMYIPEIGELSE